MYYVGVHLSLVGNAVDMLIADKSMTDQKIIYIQKRTFPRHKNCFAPVMIPNCE